MPPRQQSPADWRAHLPLLWLFSDARNDVALEQALISLPRASGFVFRHYHLDGAARRARFDALHSIAREKAHCVVLAGDPQIASEWGADGSYGPPPMTGAGLTLASAHDVAELKTAVEAGADAIALSPVFTTRSHPGAPTLGIEGFHALARHSRVPVIALGGMTAERAAVLGWPRWGAIDGLTQGSPIAGASPQRA